MSNNAFAQLREEYSGSGNEPPQNPACRDKRGTSAKKSPRHL